MRKTTKIHKKRNEKEGDARLIRSRYVGTQKQ